MENVANIITVTLGVGTSSNPSLEDTTNDIAAKLKGEHKGVQICAGFVTGLLTEKIMEKVGKSAAIVVISGLIACKVAHHAGYIDLDWANLRNQAAKTGGKIADSTGKKMPTSQQIVKFAEENVLLTTSFGGGFLTGMLF